MATKNSPPDLIRQYTRRILEEERKIEESLEAIAELSRLLARASEDTGRQLLLTRD